MYKLLATTSRIPTMQHLVYVLSHQSRNLVPFSYRSSSTSRRKIENILTVRTSRKKRRAEDLPGGGRGLLLHLNLLLSY
jgi:hypothetical protein